MKRKLYLNPKQHFIIFAKKAPEFFMELRHGRTGAFSFISRFRPPDPPE